jgi:transposase
VAAGIHDRARMIFWASQGQSPRQIAARLDYKEDHVRKWLHRFNDEGLAGLQERPGRGRKPQFSATDALAVVETVLASPG